MCVYIYLFKIYLMSISSPYYKASINCVVSQMDKSEMMIVEDWTALSMAHT
jgi:hypothetical protein